LRPPPNPAIEICGGIVTDFPGTPLRNHHCHVRRAVADIGESYVAVSVNMHLSAVLHPRNAAVVTDQCNPAGSAEAAGHAHSARNDRPKTICANDQPCPKAHRLTPFTESTRTEHSSVPTGDQIGDPKAFGDANSEGPRAVEEEGVEDVAPNSEPAIAESAEAMMREEITKDTLAVWGPNNHATELRGPSVLNELERAHGVENARRLRAQVLRAWLVARKVSTIDEEDIDALASEKPRSRCPRWSTADDQYIARGRRSTHCRSNVMPPSVKALPWRK
jgi:hypothetical protein